MAQEIGGFAHMYTCGECRFCAGIDCSGIPAPSYASVIVSGGEQASDLQAMLEEVESLGILSCVSIWCTRCRKVAVICDKTRCTSADLAHTYIFAQNLIVFKRQAVSVDALGIL
jgi:hypothetical protein